MIQFTGDDILTVFWVIFCRGCLYLQEPEQLLLPVLPPQCYYDLIS
jgi:hypothetical protein